MKDLAPGIFRKRQIIEARIRTPIDGETITDYLSALSPVLGMETIADPVSHLSEKYGWAAWIHWETSGAHVYAWDHPELFVSIDIYTCKDYDSRKALLFTQEFFDVSDIECRDV